MKIFHNYLHDLFKKSTLKRRAFFLITDVLLISFAMYISFWLRFNGVIPALAKRSLPYYILLAITLKLTFLFLFDLYDISWRFVSLEDLIKLVKALSLSTLTLGMTLFLLKVYLPFTDFPRSIFILDFILALFLIGSLRISKRALSEGLKGPFKSKEEKIRVLIYGAGGAGEQIAREMQRNKNSHYIPIGFIDDQSAKQGIMIHGVKVLGKKEDIQTIINTNKIDEVLIALPSAHSKEIKNIVEKIRESNMVRNIKILPSVTDLINGKVTLSDIHEIELEDLLGRAPVNIDFKAIKDFIQDRKILITGAGGSIGSELTKSILQFNPETLIIFDIDETEIFNLVNNLKFTPKEIIPVVGDIKDESKMASVFDNYSPEIIIHSAAYKHVPILEDFPEEAVKTNIQGTKVLAELSLKRNVEKFIFISTDKAINPTSVMGATKRTAEELLKILNQKNRTKFISVRFGNVLGSRGSVIPVFEEQIRSGGPVKVTHPEMKRYFMSTSEAVLLVLEASAIGQGGEVFILDMGEPIKILDLAKDMIRLYGYEPDVDIPIVFTHIRPGEKLCEEILSAEEGVESTEYEKVLKARSSNKRGIEVLMKKINLLLKMSSENNKDEIIKLLKDIVPTYCPSEYKLPPDYL